MIPAALYAKSANAAGLRLELHQHLLDAEQAVQAVFAEGSRWRAAWERFFRISTEDAPTFWRELCVAALFHDIGKANGGFQRAVTQPRNSAQPLRHEHLSALVLSLPAVRAFLSEGGVDADCITAAVLSHHVKAALKDEHAWCQSKGAPEVELYLQHEAIERTFERVRAMLGCSQMPSFPSQPWRAAPPWDEAFQNGRRRAIQLQRDLVKPSASQRRRRIAALKAGLIVADSVASAMFREGKSIEEWLRENAHRPPISEQEIEEAVLSPRARAVEVKSGRAFALHPFQRLSSEQGPRVSLVAPCGAGKTLAAWAWAKRQARQHAFGRVVFLYPTRGTATEGFRDYVGWAPEGEGTLLHGTSPYEIAAMSDNPPESLMGKAVERSEADARMFALGLWRFRFFSATVDQFLSFMQNRYQSLCLLPALADAAIVFDEVHSYDRTMFDLLTQFLEEFDVPVLCMTATLPPERAKRLRDVGLASFPREEHRDELADFKQTAAHPRYNIRYEDKACNAIGFGVDAFRRGKRVLVVVNRVARCVEVARMVAASIGVAPLVYHSRFRLKDRQQRHRDVVAAFQKEGAAVAITTQVCEMSLDLDAQVLVTEVAPVSSLVQRFGRANRHLARPGELADVLVYPPDSPLPYAVDALEGATRFVEAVAGITNQEQLAACLEVGDYTPREVSLGEAGNFLTGGYFAIPGSLREEDDHSVQCVLEEDLAEVERRYGRRETIDEYVLPAPRKCTVESNARLPQHLRVVPSGSYDGVYGLEV